MYLLFSITNYMYGINHRYISLHNMHVLAVLGPLHGEFFNPKEFCVKKLSLTNPKWTSHPLEYNKIIVMQQFFNLCVVR